LPKILLYTAFFIAASNSEQIIHEYLKLCFKQNELPLFYVNFHHSKRQHTHTYKTARQRSIRRKHSDSADLSFRIMMAIPFARPHKTWRNYDFVQMALWEEMCLSGVE
jgi:hypothetical protein